MKKQTNYNFVKSESKALSQSRFRYLHLRRSSIFVLLSAAALEACSGGADDLTGTGTISFEANGNALASLDGQSDVVPSPYLIADSFEPDVREDESGGKNYYYLLGAVPEGTNIEENTVEETIPEKTEPVSQNTPDTDVKFVVEGKKLHLVSSKIIDDVNSNQIYDVALDYGGKSYSQRYKFDNSNAENEVSETNTGELSPDVDSNSNSNPVDKVSEPDNDVLNSDAPPEFIGGSELNIQLDEGSYIASMLVAFVSASDPDGFDTVTLSLKEGSSVPGGLRFEILDDDASVGTIHVLSGAVFDYEDPGLSGLSSDKKGYSFTLVATESDGGFSELTVNIEILDVDDAPVITTLSYEYDENTEAGTSIVDLGASDDDGDAISWSIVSGNDDGLFAIDSDNGELVFSESPDFETHDASHTLIIEASSGPSGNLQTDTLEVHITINDVDEVSVINDEVDEAPVIVQPDSDTFIYDENIEAGTSIVDLDAFDPDDGDDISWSIKDDAYADLFAIDSSTGILSFKESPDFEASSGTLNGGVRTYALVIQASSIGSSGEVQTDSLEAHITINDVDEVQPDSDTFIYDENIAAGTSIVDLDAYDPDGDIISWSIVSGNDDGLFTINSDNGELVFSESPDFETHGASRSLIIQASSIGSSGEVQTDSLEVHITINDVDEAPVIATPDSDSFTYDESTEIGTSIVDLDAFDPDDDDISWSIVSGNDEGLFAIDSDGDLSFVTSPDFETHDASRSLIIQASSIGSSGEVQTAEQVLTIRITDVDEAPVINLPDSFTYDENTEVGTSIVDLDAFDPDGDDISWSIVSGNDDGLFTINSDTGDLYFSASPDFEIHGAFRTLTIRASSIGSSNIEQSAEQVLTITINDEDEAPVITSSVPDAASTTFEENIEDLSITTITASDDDDDDISWSIVSGNDEGLFAIDSDNGELVFSESPDFEALTGGTLGSNARTYELVIEASSIGSGNIELSDSLEVHITINDVDEAPVINLPDSFTYDENTEVGTSIVDLDAFDPDGDDISWSIVSGNDDGLFTINSDTGDLYFSASPDFEIHGAFRTLTIRASSIGSSNIEQSAEQVLTITINDEDEAPVITSSVPDAASTTFEENIEDLSITTITASDDDDDDISWSIVSGNDEGLFAIDSDNGELVFSESPDFEALTGGTLGSNARTYELVIEASSIGSGNIELSDSLEVHITINDVDEAPVINLPDSFTYDENTEVGTSIVDLDAFDPDGDDISWSIVSGNDDGLFVIHSITGDLSFSESPDFEALTGGTLGSNARTYELVIQASSIGSSGEVQTDSLEVHITINDVDEAPVIIDDRDEEIRVAEVNNGLIEWSRGDGDIILPNKVYSADEVTLLLKGTAGNPLNFSDLSFSRELPDEPSRITSGREYFDSTSITITIAASSEGADDGGVITIGYTDFETDPYKMNADRLQIDSDGDGDIDIDLSLFGERSFTNRGGDYTVTGNNGVDDLIIGSSLRDKIEGGAGSGDDYIYGGEGGDWLLGHSGSDHLYGGAGIDHLYSGHGNDHLYGGTNNNLYNFDQLYGGYGDDKYYYSIGDGNDYIHEGLNQGDEDILILQNISVDDVSGFYRYNYRYQIDSNGYHLRIVFNDDGYITLRDSFNDTPEEGIDQIHFDTNENGIVDAGETVWYDDYSSDTSLFSFSDALAMYNYNVSVGSSLAGEIGSATDVDRIYLNELSVGTKYTFAVSPDGIGEVLSTLYKVDGDTTTEVEFYNGAFIADDNYDYYIDVSTPSSNPYIGGYRVSLSRVAEVNNELVGLVEWSRGDANITLPNKVYSADEVTLVLKGTPAIGTEPANPLNFSDLSFSRELPDEPTGQRDDKDYFDSTSITITIDGFDGGVIEIGYTDFRPNYYDTNADILRIDANGNGIVDDDDFELSLWKQRSLGSFPSSYTATVRGTSASELIIGSSLREQIWGSSGEDYIYGLEGDDWLDGGVGNDTFYGGAGDDKLYGGYGNDKYYYSIGDGNDTITEFSNYGEDILILQGISTDDVSKFERYNGGDTLDPNGNDPRITFNDDDDSYIRIRYGFNDTQSGVDQIHFDTNENGIVDTGETVWYDDDSSDESLISFSEALAIYGAVGDDDDMNGRDVAEVNGLVEWSRGDENITLPNKVSSADEVTLLLKGTAGNPLNFSDLSFSRELPDEPSRITSGREYFDSTSITITIAASSEGADDGGVITIGYTDFETDPYKMNADRLQIDSDGDGDIDIDLSLFGERSFTNRGGDYTVTGNNGVDDLIIGSSLRDKIEGGAGSGDDYIYGGEGGDWLLGHSGSDHLYGGAGIDHLYGGHGNDHLYGGTNNSLYNSDHLYGGYGDDKYYYSLGDGNDLIREHSNEGDEDILILQNISVDDVSGFYRYNYYDNVIDSNGTDLRIVFNDDDASYIKLLESFNDTPEEGIEQIHFDTNGDGIVDAGETVWYDDYSSDTSLFSFSDALAMYNYNVSVGAELEGRISSDDDIDRIYLNELSIGTKYTFAVSPDGIGEVLSTLYKVDGDTTTEVEFYNGAFIADDNYDYYIDVSTPSSNPYIGGYSVSLSRVAEVNNELVGLVEWSRGDANITLPNKVYSADEVTLVLKGTPAIGTEPANPLNFSDLSFSRELPDEPTGQRDDKDYFDSTSITITIDGFDGGVIEIGYTDFRPNYYDTNADILRIDANGNGIVDDDDFELSLWKQRSFTWDGNSSYTPTVRGTSASELIIGSSLRDKIKGGSGEDYIYGLEGDDWLDGGVGNDTFYGGDGNDELYGGYGDDTYYYSLGDRNDTIYESYHDDEDILILQNISTDDIKGFYRYNYYDDVIDSNGTDLRIVFNDDGYITLRGSFNTTSQGVEQIHFDTNSDGVKDVGEVIWYDDDSSDESLISFADALDFVWGV